MTNERAGTVSFYEIWDGDNLLVPDVGFCVDDPQAAATALAKMLSPTAEAHFDRVGDVYVP